MPKKRKKTPQGPLWTASPKCDPRLRRYLEGRVVASIAFDSKAKRYRVRDTQLCPGLLSALRKRYYPRFKRKRRRVNASNPLPRRLPSSAALGKRVDAQIARYIANHKDVPMEALASAVVLYIEEHAGHTFQAAQVPVLVRCVPGAGRALRVTQADFVTRDPDTGELWMWELKTGYNRVHAQGTLSNVRGARVPNNVNNHWQLQRHYTHAALTAAGVPIAQSRVIQVYAERGGKVTVRVRKNESWIERVQ